MTLLLFKQKQLCLDLICALDATNIYKNDIFIYIQRVSIMHKLMYLLSASILLWDMIFPLISKENMKHLEDFKKVCELDVVTLMNISADDDDKYDEEQELDEDKNMNGIVAKCNIWTELIRMYMKSNHCTAYYQGICYIYKLVECTANYTDLHRLQNCIISDAFVYDEIKKWLERRDYEVRLYE